MEGQRTVLGAIDGNLLRQRQRPLQIQKTQLNTNRIDKENTKQQNAKSEKLVQPPVAQFQAFSVYESTSAEKPTSSKAAAVKVNVSLKEKPIPVNVLKLHTRNSPLQKIKDEDAAASPSILDVSMSSNSSMVRSETKKYEEKKATAKTIREQFFHVTQYREEIYNYMREIEKKYRSRPDYMRRQADITQSMRAILVDWLVEVSEEYRLQTETLYLAVSYIDRFLSFMSVVRGKLQLVGTTAMFIASKFEEIYPPELGEFVYITDETYNKKQVLRMEHLILKVLSFDLSTPTPLAFISLFCISNGLSQRTLYLAMYISELSLLEAEPFLVYPSSILGASALAVARHALLCCHCHNDTSVDNEELISPSSACMQAAWPSALKRSSGYDLTDLEGCMRELGRTHAKALTQPHQAIVEKYKSNKHEAVATIKPKSMYLPVDKSNVSMNSNSDSNNKENEA